LPATGARSSTNPSATPGATNPGSTKPSSATPRAGSNSTSTSPTNGNATAPNATTSPAQRPAGNLGNPANPAGIQNTTGNNQVLPGTIRNPANPNATVNTNPGVNPNGTVNPAATVNTPAGTTTAPSSITGADLARSLNFSTSQGSLQVTDITGNSWAQMAGVQRNDIVTAVNGQPVGTTVQFQTALQRAALANGPFSVTVNRNGQTVMLNASMPQSSLTTNASLQPRINDTSSSSFSADFDRWSNDFNRSLSTVQGDLRTQLDQFNSRVQTLRNSMNGVEQQRPANMPELRAQMRRLDMQLNMLINQADSSARPSLNGLRARLHALMNASVNTPPQQNQPLPPSSTP